MRLFEMQSRHAAPAVPQALLADPARQVPFWQHPLQFAHAPEPPAAPPPAPPPPALPPAVIEHEPAVHVPEQALQVAPLVPHDEALVPPTHAPAESQHPMQFPGPHFDGPQLTAMVAAAPSISTRRSA